MGFLGTSASFTGRDSELRQLKGLAADAAQGKPHVVLIEGEAGVGKTALARKFLGELDDFLVLACSAVACGTDHTYGAVGRLISRVPTHILERYPLISGDIPVRAEPQAVARDFFRMLDDLQQTSPIALVVDDVQWADQASLDVLALTLSRFWVDSVLTVFLMRGSTRGLSAPTPAPLTTTSEIVRMRLTGLDIGQIRELAEIAHPSRDVTRLADQVHKQTGGNALYVTALLNDLPPDQLELPNLLERLPQTLTSTISSLSASLPDETQKLLHALAVLDAPTPLATLGQLVDVPNPASALDSALKSGFVEWRPEDPSSTVRIRHALQREAIYRAIPPQRRRELHSAAVPLVDSTSAWLHRVSAVDRVDDELASQLEVFAQSEAAEGWLGRAATHLVWASKLSPSRSDRERRLLMAGVFMLMGEDATRAEEHLEAFTACRHCALRDAVLGFRAIMKLDFATAVRLLNDAWKNGEREGDPFATTAASVQLHGLYVWLGDGDHAVDAGRRTVAHIPLDSTRAEFARGMLAEARAMQCGPRLALRELYDEDVSSDPAVDRILWRGMIRLDACELTGAMDDLNAVCTAMRESTVAPVAGTRAYYSLALAQHMAGRWNEAAMSIEYALSVSLNGRRFWDFSRAHMVATQIAASRGDWDMAARHVAAAQQVAVMSTAQQEKVGAILAQAALAKARNDSHAVVKHLSQLLVEPINGNGYAREFELWWLPDYVEALIAVRRPQDASATLRHLEAAAGDTAYMQPVLARLRGMLAEQYQPDFALRHYLHGTGLPEHRDHSPLSRALLEQSCGRWLRKLGKSDEAMRWLHAARDRYTGLGAVPYLERCEQELAKCSARVHTAAPQVRLNLTRRERDVANFVARGLTNNEIAAQIFVSRKTVEYHLGRIFTKTGTANRRELRDLVQQELAMT